METWNVENSVVILTTDGHDIHLNCFFTNVCYETSTLCEMSIVIISTFMVNKMFIIVMDVITNIEQLFYVYACVFIL